jgi:hypothetical protein
VCIGGGHGSDFVISTLSEKELLSTLRWRVLACVYGGPVLTVVCLTLIFKLYMTVGP